MKKLLLCLCVVLVPFSAAAEHHEPVADEIRAMEETFNGAYAANEVDKYFSFYADDASLYFFGARQDVAAYHDEWQATIAAGSAVEKNDLSDMRIQVMPGGAVAIATFFIDYRLRSADGEAIVCHH